jgi:hypothetical protein
MTTNPISLPALLIMISAAMTDCDASKIDDFRTIADSFDDSAARDAAHSLIDLLDD